MTNTNFDKLKTIWTDLSTADGTPGTAGNEGEGVYYANMVTTPTTPPLGTIVAADKTDPVRGHAPFSRFTCTAVGVPAAEKQSCYKYQLRDFETEWSQGNVRFERSQRVNYYMINGRGWDEAYSLFQGQTILTGASTLAVSMALATAAALSF